MPTSSRRKSSKPAPAPLDLDEIEQDPGFRGMLSFLKVSPEENQRQLALRQEADRQIPMGESPTGASNTTPVESVISREPEPSKPALMDPVAIEPPSELPMGHSPAGSSGPMPIPRMDVEGRGKRPLRFCRTVQDGHTSSEEIAYQALWAHARRYGQADADGSRVVDLALSQLQTILNTDHKNVKRLVLSLKSKLALEIVRPPDYRRALSTRYRIFDQQQILERRRAAELLWVVRTRAVRFVPIDIVNQLLVL
jgi:hypothetical protein